jgi:hypothetical protein
MGKRGANVDEVIVGGSTEKGVLSQDQHVRVIHVKIQKVIIFVHFCVAVTKYLRLGTL